jgi:hypothetical protein
MPDNQPIGYSPTVMKRALSRMLVEWRKKVGMTTYDVQGVVGWSPTKLNHIEKARWVKPNGDDVADLCELYGVPARERDAMIQMARDARKRGWWRRYNDVFADEYPGFEAGASMIRNFETRLIPGLLQVPGYIELVTRISGINDSDEIKRHIDARVQRQQILTRDESPCRLHAVIDENAILRITDPRLRAEQIQHLRAMTERSTVDIQVLSISSGVYPGGSEPFAYLSFPDPADRDLIYLETTIDSRFLEEDDELERYMVRFNRLCTAALDVDATRTHLEKQIE